MSFKPRERNDFISVIPDDLGLFEETDIRPMFEYMEKTFHLSHKWHEDFKKELLKIERGVSVQEHFFRYATSHIDPALQRILMRKDSVIFALARYLLKDRIMQRKKEVNAQKNFYRNGEWKER